MRLGVHVSIAGGLGRALERADAAGCEAIQIFTASGRGWRVVPRDPEEVASFAKEARRRRLPVFAHGSYLINLAAPGGELLERSRAAFVAELERCEALGIEAVVVHPGAHLGEGAARGLAQVARSVRDALRATRGYRVRVLVELTAGQGTCLGGRFEDLRAILDGIGRPERTGVCFDTCHALAAGYELRTTQGYVTTWASFERIVGLEALGIFHLNDSKTDLGSHVDRHETIGQGRLGVAFFRRLVTDPRFAGMPAVVELPPEAARRSLSRLKSWRRAAKMKANA